MRVEYAEYMESSVWQQRAELMKDFADQRCEYCGRQSERPLHAHHLNYRRLGDESPQDIVVLCKGCHKATHSGHQPHGWELALIATTHPLEFDDIVAYDRSHSGWAYDFVPEPKDDRLPGEMES